VKNGAHPLELIGHMAGLFLAGVTQNDEVRAVNFQPTLGLSVRYSGEGSDQTEQ
jgi:hypothetical protein